MSRGPLRRLGAGLRSAGARLRRSSGIDWDEEGLLEGAGNERERAEREQLLEELARADVPLEDLRRAVQQDRLAVLPIERVLAGEERHTLADLAETAGLDEELITRTLAALGLPVPEPGACAFDDDDLALAERMGLFVEAGLDPEGMLEVSRVMGLGAAQTAAAARELIVETFLQPGGGERDYGLRVAPIAENLAPELEAVVGHLVRVHLREHVRREVIGRTELRLGVVPDTVEVTVAFADLVGFTALGEQGRPGDLGRLAGRLAAAAGEVARPPVRLVKVLGDGVMLAAAEPAPLLDAVLCLLEADLPPLRAGVARGTAVARRGDLFGAPVNLASRLSELAEEGTALADERVRDAIPGRDGVALRPAGRRSVKGVDRELSVFAVERAGDRG